MFTDGSVFLYSNVCMLDSLYSFCRGHAALVYLLNLIRDDVILRPMKPHTRWMGDGLYLVLLV